MKTFILVTELIFPATPKTQRSPYTSIIGIAWQVYPDGDIHNYDYIGSVTDSYGRRSPNSFTDVLYDDGAWHVYSDGYVSFNRNVDLSYGISC